jgi:hypothetical protein
MVDWEPTVDDDRIDGVMTQGARLCVREDEALQEGRDLPGLARELGLLLLEASRRAQEGAHAALGLGHPDIHS